MRRRWDVTLAKLVHEGEELTRIGDSSAYDGLDECHMDNGRVKSSTRVLHVCISNEGSVEYVARCLQYVKTRGEVDLSVPAYPVSPPVRPHFSV